MQQMGHLVEIIVLVGQDNDVVHGTPSGLNADPRFHRQAESLTAIKFAKQGKITELGAHLHPGMRQDETE
jgi:hypothetical protein